MRRRIDGFGFHEVIIDSPDHARCMALLSDAQVANILRAYKQRYNALSLDQRIVHITIFKNHGNGRGRQLAASAFAAHRDAGDSQPGAAPVVRGAAPL